MNVVEESGIIVSDLREESVNRGEKFYVFDLSVTRQSGAKDILQCRVSERLTNFDGLAKDKVVKITGRFASHREYKNSAMHLCLSVFVLSIDEFYDNADFEHTNSVTLQGKISKIRDFKNIGSRVVQELNLLVPRGEYDKQDLIPLVTWGRQASYCNEKLKAGDIIKVTGRIQSRDRVGNSGENYRLYNVSVIDLEVVSFAEPNEDNASEEIAG